MLIFQNSPVDALISSGSESEENLEDLLAEYQHYLDKAHKQRVNYLDKSKTKNKVPVIRHERFSKTKPGAGVKYEDYYYTNGYMNPNKMQVPINSPLDIFIPMSPKLRFVNDPELTTTQPNGNELLPTFDKRLIDLPPLIPKPIFDSIKSPCICKNNQIPCQQCLISFETVSQNYIPQNKFITLEGENKPLIQNSEYFTEEKFRDTADNTINIRVKVDIQLPKAQDLFAKGIKNRSRDEDINSRESFNVPFPFFNFPIPMDLFGFKRSPKFSRHDSAHKITIHKKKKARLSNNNKKHRKKVVTFHSLNVEPQRSLKNTPYFEESFNLTNNETKLSKSNETFPINMTAVDLQKPEAPSNNSIITNKTNELLNNETLPDDSIYVMVNISSTADNVTEDVHKIENSVETEYAKTDAVTPIGKLSKLRRKRDASSAKNQTLFIVNTSPVYVKNTTSVLSIKSESSPSTETSSNISPTTIKQNSTNEKIVKHIPPLAKSNDKKALFADTELTYWPNMMNVSAVTSKNITMIILERETKRAKLNMSKEAIRNNHTRALEKAIFGDVNWDDVDTVAPVFMSFVGKYIRGVLTFCSENTCHSMKCAEKTCVHRICSPNERWNHRGHCAGSNKTGTSK